MKKLLLATALTALVGAASAQTVTVYGQLDVGYGETKSTATSGGVVQKSSGLTEANTAGNRLGFKGTEDLGNGLKANFVVETSIAMTQPVNFAKWDGSGHQTWSTTTYGAGSANGVGTSYNRQSYVGLASNALGEIRLGYQYTDAYLAGVSNIAGFEPTTGGTSHLHGLPAVRAALISYRSPTFNGVSVGAQFGNNATDYDNSSVTDYENKIANASVHYKRGPLSVSGVVTRIRSDLSSTAATLTTKNQGLIGGSYDFGHAKVYASLSKGDAKTNDGTASTIDYKHQYVGVSVPLNRTTIFAQVGKAKSDQGGDKINDRTLYQAGAKYDLSKRTFVYAVYGKDNEDVASTTKYDWSTYRVGMRHSF